MNFEIIDANIQLTESRDMEMKIALLLIIKKRIRMTLNLLYALLKTLEIFSLIHWKKKAKNI